LAALEAGIAAGEEARVAAIPLKMTLFDNTAAFLPVHQPPDVETRLIVRDPVLLDALSALFEMYWDNGLPLQIHKGRAEVADHDDGEPSEAERRLLVLLVAGLSDREIGIQLTLSERTVRSRVRSLMTRLDAGTRFQAGYQAVLRGWIADVG
jgi:DNA-binding NarL/FixJ family response regulator